ncbi:MAG: hypothetical protein NWE90_02530, partial [Candidatus Bathyarchaeota archaeon]|nr:hypothetical protein [Candidatus Bathyarchaeota archaeon]
QLVENAYIDPQGRAILNVRWIIGKGRVVPFTTIRKVILLKRDLKDNRITRTINADEALEFLEKESFCNPHLLVRSDRKKNLRNQFFKKFLDRIEIYMVNATPPPLETNEVIKEICVKS